MIRVRKLAVALGVTAAITSGAVAQAQASTVPTPTSSPSAATTCTVTNHDLDAAGNIVGGCRGGWGGKCYTTINDRNTVGGWCDGNGPSFVYQARADCYNGRQTSGKQRWAGDRRGSFAYCAGNGGIDPRYFHGIVKNW